MRPLSCPSVRDDAFECSQPLDGRAFSTSVKARFAQPLNYPNIRRGKTLAENSCAAKKPLCFRVSISAVRPTTAGQHRQPILTRSDLITNGCRNGATPQDGFAPDIPRAPKRGIGKRCCRVAVPAAYVRHAARACLGLRSDAPGSCQQSDPSP